VWTHRRAPNRGRAQLTASCHSTCPLPGMSSPAFPGPAGSCHAGAHRDSLTALPGLPALPQPPALLVYGADAMYFAGSLGGSWPFEPPVDIKPVPGECGCRHHGFDRGQAGALGSARTGYGSFPATHWGGSAPPTAIRHRPGAQSLFPAPPVFPSSGTDDSSHGDRMPHGGPRRGRAWTERHGERGGTIAGIRGNFLAVQVSPHRPAGLPRTS